MDQTSRDHNQQSWEIGNSFTTMSQRQGPIEAFYLHAGRRCVGLWNSVGRCYRRIGRLDLQGPGTPRISRGLEFCWRVRCGHA